jgi:AcrR family transcriptional regulator
MAGKRASKGRRSTSVPPLGPDAVVAAALELIDEVGVAGFTMRALADRLGTYPATLYWHVGNRNDILARVLQVVLDEMDVVDPSSMRWDLWLERVASEYRRALHEHPNVAALVLYPLLTAPTLVEAILHALHRGGFRGPALASAFNAFTGSVTGWVAVELSAGSGESDQKWRAEFEARVRALPPAEFPTIAANMADLADEVFTLRWHGGGEKPLDRSFEAALRVWISGLRALRRASRPQ